MYTGAYGVQKRRLDPLELELLEVLTTRQTSIQEDRLWSSGIVYDLSCYIISLAPHTVFL